MLKLLIITILSVIITNVFGGVLILTPKKYEISSLKPFDEVSYINLQHNFKKSRIISFKIQSDQLPDECEELTDTKFTSYVPNVDYVPENVIVMKHEGKENCAEIKKRIRLFDFDNKKNIVYLIMHKTKRVKRELDDPTTETQTTITSTTPQTTNTPSSPSPTTPSISSSPFPTTVDESTTPIASTVAATTQESAKTLPEKPVFKERQAISPEKPVLYTSDGKAMLYSSQAPRLLINDTTFILGPATIVRIDDRADYLRLVCSIPVENGKISLRFKFPTDGGYWSLTSVEVVDTELRVYNLSITSDVTAPRGFSHRCGGQTIFTDGSVKLILYEMQVQPKTVNYRFNNAYNCVPFMTGPIWSGIFVTSILAIGLIVGLSAMFSIKTMDKFDNAKTKQLTITLMGE